MRGRVGIWAVALLALPALAVDKAAPVIADPTGITVTPRVAATSATVTISGATCSSSVDVNETAFLFPTVSKTVTGQTVTPDSSGNWVATFPLPAAPAYVTATCDGHTAVPPTVVAPNDVAVGTMAYAELTPTDVRITTSPLVDGSELSVFTQSGTLLGASVAAAGTASVHLPRSLGPIPVIATFLRQHDPGIPDLEFVPRAAVIQLPQATAPSVIVSRRVTQAGGAVLASGNCTGSAHLTVMSQAGGWFIDPVQLFTDDPAVAGGLWTSSFAMPSVPATVTLACTAGITEFASVLISPSSGGVAVVGQPDGQGVTVTLPSAFPDGIEAFVPGGREVPLSVVGSTSGGTIVRLQPSGPSRVVVIGVESLGENANAHQNSRVQSWVFDVGSISEGAPIGTLVPAHRVLLDS